MDFYTDAEAKKAVTDADAIVRWWQGLLPSAPRDSGLGLTLQRPRASLARGRS
jgi:hypothetical protein